MLMPGISNVEVRNRFTLSIKKVECNGDVGYKYVSPEARF